VRPIYSLDRLVAAKQRGWNVFSKTDSHWTPLGAFFAYRELGEALTERVPFHFVAGRDVEFREITAVGDLGFKCDPEETSSTLDAAVHEPPVRLLTDNCVAAQGSFVVTACPSAPDTTCVLLGDSFSYALLPFLAATFRRLVFALTPFLDRRLVEAECPDVVVSVINDRFLLEAPRDHPSRSYEEKANVPGVARRPRLDWGWVPDRYSQLISVNNRPYN
jgi:hypothetical protein